MASRGDQKSVFSIFPVLRGANRGEPESMEPLGAVFRSAVGAIFLVI